jgi:hypothetical protein
LKNIRSFKGKGIGQTSQIGTRKEKTDLKERYLNEIAWNANPTRIM